MRYLMVIGAIAALMTSALAAEINIGLDRCVIFNNLGDNAAPSKIALHFALPDTIVGKEIVYAELRGWLSLHHDGPDSLFELRFCPILADWRDGAYNYQSLEAITDSMSAGVYTIRLGDSSAFFVDVTDFIRNIAQRERTNYGLIGTADLLGDANIQLPEALGERLRDMIRLRVIYK